MILYFIAKCRELKCSALEFFEMAYVDTFKKFPPNLGDDYAQYLMHSVIPPYAVSFLKRIQEKDGDGCLQCDLPLQVEVERIP